MLRVVALIALSLLISVAQAQAEDIEFDVEIYEVEGTAGSENFTPVTEARPGDIIEYRVYAHNAGDVIYRPGTVVVSLPISDGFTLIPGSLRSNDPATLEFSRDGTRFEDMEGTSPDRDTPSIVRHVRVTYTVPFEPGQESALAYRVIVEPGNALVARPGSGPVPPPKADANGSSATSQMSAPGNFAFERVRLLQSSSSYAQVVGEISSRTSYEAVMVRVTLRDRAGSILATETFFVESVGPAARVFDALIRDVRVEDVADTEFQIERTY